MKILIAKTAGFCMGVRRAVDLALEASQKCKPPIYTYGPLIHNPQVLDLLAEKGITPLAHIPEKGNGTVIVRAHGVPPAHRDRLRAAGFSVIDATCPRVVKVQSIIRKHARQGCAVIIVGDQDHPEVVGLLGYAGKNGHIVDSLARRDALPAFEKAIIVAQTTQNTSFFEKIRCWAADRFPHYQVFDTICDSTQKRQEEISRLAGEVDAAVVVGGRNSGNTQRLAEIVRQTGKPVLSVETEEEIDPALLSGARSVALTAGASTPNWITNRVYRHLETLSGTTRPGIGNLLFKLRRASLLTALYLALGAGCLCYACNRLQGITTHLPYLLMAFPYVLSMHLINNLTGRSSDRYKDPERARFYTRHQAALSTLAVLAGATGLLTAFSLGTLPFLLLLLMSVTGLMYNIPMVSEAAANGRPRRLRDIPGSKTILIALAWGMVTAALPPLSAGIAWSWGNLVVLLWACGMVFVRTAFFDILDMQADRIVGRETIPILLGRKTVTRLLRTILCALLVLLTSAAALGKVSSLGYVLACCPACLFFVITAHERMGLLPGTRLEFLVETHFVLSGALTVVWSAC